MGYFSALFLFLFSASFVYGEEFKVPQLTGPVVDRANMLSPSFKRSLSKSLYRLKKATANDPLEIAVLTVAEMKGLTIEQASIKVIDQWKLGGEKGDRGLLLMLAKKERKARIEVGQGLEGLITDAFSSQVIDHMIPLFRAGRIDEGVLLGVSSIAQRATPNQDVSKLLGPSSKDRQWSRRSKSRRKLSLLPLIIFALIFIFGGPGTRRGLIAGMLLGGMGGGGRRGGFGDGGGGFGGGGGGFSGGGASGGW